MNNGPAVVTSIAGAGQGFGGGLLTGVTLGPPGVYFAPVAPATPRLTVEPMDVAGFVGVAPRGPAWELVDDPTLGEQGAFRARSVAVPLDRWDDYLELFGGFEGPGLLPYAVAAYFAQGGRRAYVVRIVTAADGQEAPAGCAVYRLQIGSPPLRLRARNEGAWGNRLVIAMTFTRRPFQASGLSADKILLGPGSVVPAGTTLRISTPGQDAALRVVSAVTRTGRRADPGYDVVAALDRPAPVTAASTFEVVEAELAIDDQDPVRPRQERHTALGLGPAHPRFLADVLTAGSRLVEAVTGGTWALLPDASLPSLDAKRVEDGEDRWGSVTLADIFPRGNEPPGTGGADAIRSAPEVATVVVPDLYAPAAAAPEQEPGAPAASSPRFEVCAPRPPAPATVAPAGPLTGLWLNPSDSDDLARIVDQQRQLVQLAEDLQVVTLLDVPPGLRPAQVPHWRSQFDSAYAAGYHPWLRGVDPRNVLSQVPPSAVAAGLIARCELREGISRGPANEVAGGIVDVADLVDDAQHAALHRLGVDVFRMQPDGVYLTSARTLSMDPAWRQLSVRRLLLLIERAVQRQLQWTVFEPNDQQLREALRQQLDALLATLFADGCFAGATPQDSWFVHVASGALLAAEADSGQLIAEVGVAPSAPIEFIVVRVAIQAEGAIKTTVTTGPAVIGHG
jgi:uncharacterized protein